MTHDDEKDEFDFYLDFDPDPDLFFLDPTIPPPPETRTAEKPPAPAEKRKRTFVPVPTPAYLKATPGDKRNQRRHLRFRAENATTTIRSKGLLTSLGLGRGRVARSAINLSEGGTLLLSNDPFKTDTLVRVTVEIDNPPDRLESQGIVRWCKSDRNRPDLFYVGIEFQGLDSVQRMKIARMREWFNSPAFKAKEATRRRSRPKTNA